MPGQRDDEQPDTDQPDDERRDDAQPDAEHRSAERPAVGGRGTAGWAGGPVSSVDGPSPRWRVRPALPVLKLTGAALLLALGVLLSGGDPVRIGVAALAALGLVTWGARDVVAPVRLAADPTGITVISGYAGRRHVPWATIERIGVDTRPRLGLRTETLEIDAGESLHLFSQYDLGDTPTEVAGVLQRLRTAYSAGGPAR